MGDFRMEQALDDAQARKDNPLVNIFAGTDSDGPEDGEYDANDPDAKTIPPDQD